MTRMQTKKGVIAINEYACIVGLTIHAVGPQAWGDTVVLNVTWTSGSMISAWCYNSDSASGAECGDFSFTEVRLFAVHATADFDASCFLTKID